MEMRMRNGIFLFLYCFDFVYLFILFTGSKPLEGRAGGKGGKNERKTWQKKNKNHEDEKKKTL
jgi:hypothetical protein